MNKIMTTEQKVGMLEDLKAWMEKWNIVINDPTYNRDDGKYQIEIPPTPLHAENLGTLINLEEAKNVILKEIEENEEAAIERTKCCTPIGETPPLI